MVDITSPTLFTGRVAVFVGLLGVALLALAPLPAIPAPWGLVVGVVGFTLASLAGASAKAFTWTAGAPILAGAALGIATSTESALALLIQMVPPGWLQNLLAGVIGLLAILAGKASPQLGAHQVEPVYADPADVGPGMKAQPVSDLDEARRILGGGR